VKVLIPGSCSGVLGLPAAALVGSLLMMSCASARSAANAVAPAKLAASMEAKPTPVRAAVPDMIRDDDAQGDAQHAWCTYLEALYLRATDGAKSWPRLSQCNVVRTPAAPAMLRRTAECSIAALRKFDGDPFTPAYAAEVTRCGRASLDATTMPASELAPFVKSICARAVACGTLTDAACHEAIADTLGPSLCRAVGAINERGRAELRACLDSAACDGVSDQITGCLTPIMDRLLWLPE
jgi:hypothetical protein